MDVPLDFREAEGFRVSWAIASYEQGRASEEFDGQVLAAVDELLSKRPGFGLPSPTPEHSFPLPHDHELVYEWATDFNPQGRAVAHHLDLLLVRRKK
jgi:hypothetical protein